jgi:hypothetical protein
MPDCTCGGQRFWDSECRTSIFALVSNARHFHLCDGLVPCRERRREGRDDQMVRLSSGGIGFRSGSVRKKRCAEKGCIVALSEPIPCHGELALCPR